VLVKKLKKLKRRLIKLPGSLDNQAVRLQVVPIK